jgi:hypothetical protein
VYAGVVTNRFFARRAATLFLPRQDRPCRCRNVDWSRRAGRKAFAFHLAFQEARTAR